MPSALEDFTSSLRQAEVLIARERRFKDPPTVRSQTAVLALRGGATVLMVATFERFLRDMTAEHLERLVRRPPPIPFEDLPEKLQTSSVWSSLDVAMKGRSAGLPSGRIHRLPRIRRAAGLIVDGLIDPSALSETGGNPGSDTVREMLGNCGVANIFGQIRPAFEAAWGRPEAQEFVPVKLDAIVDSRHRVAHRADALSISRSQLAEWPGFLRILAGLLYHELGRHVDDLLAVT